MHLHGIHIVEFADLPVCTQDIVSAKQRRIELLFAHRWNIERFLAADGDQIAHDGIARGQAAGALAIEFQLADRIADERGQVEVVRTLASREWTDSAIGSTTQQ